MSKIAWLRQRTDRHLATVEGGRLLDALEAHPRADRLAPWLAREYKLGHVTVEDDGVIATAYPGTEVRFDAETLIHWADWERSRHHTRRGVDLMRLTVAQAAQRVAAWTLDVTASAHEHAVEAARVLWTDRDGWTVQQLGAGDLRAEGAAMGHCVGDPFYQRQVAQGHAIILSLRDPHGRPRATVELAAGSPPLLVQALGRANTPLTADREARLAAYFRTLPGPDRPRAGGEPCGRVSQLRSDPPGCLGLHRHVRWDAVLRSLVFPPATRQGVPPNVASQDCELVAARACQAGETAALLAACDRYQQTAERQLEQIGGTWPGSAWQAAIDLVRAAASG